MNGMMKVNTLTSIYSACKRSILLVSRRLLMLAPCFLLSKRSFLVKKAKKNIIFQFLSEFILFYLFYLFFI